MEEVIEDFNDLLDVTTEPDLEIPIKEETKIEGNYRTNYLIRCFFKIAILH